MEYLYRFHRVDGEQTDDVQGCACCQCEVKLAWFPADRFTEGRYHCEICATSNIPTSTHPDARILAQVANHLKSWVAERLSIPTPEE